jgi:hypothetical protein
MLLLTLFAYRPGTLIGIAAIVAWVLCVAVAFKDLFGRHDLGAGGKVVWVLVVVLLPIVGLLVYFLASAARPPSR